MPLTITDPNNKRVLQLSYPAEAYDTLIDGYAAALGFRSDGQETSAEGFPMAKLHPSYSDSRKTWKPTKEQFVRASILVEAASRAAQGQTQLDAEASAEQNKADADTVLGNGWATIEDVTV